MSEVAPGSAGGYGVPVLIDPSIILTSGAGAAPILDVCRVARVTTNQWKGVSSARHDVELGRRRFRGVATTRRRWRSRSSRCT